MCAQTQGAIIPAIGTASSTAAVRSLGRRGVKTIVVSERDTPPAFRSQYCDKQVAVPDPTSDFAGYEQALLTLAEQEDVQTILPFREPDIYALARNREQLRTHLGTPWPTLDTLGQVQDRITLRDAAAEAGVSMPRTEPLDQFEEWETPSIIKPRYTMRAPEYARAFDSVSPTLASTTYLPPGSEPDINAIIDEMGHVPLVQEYVPTTDEYGFFAQYRNGTPVATFQHRQRRGWKYSGGPSAYRESVSIPALESAGRAVLDALDWHGVAMVEFLRDPETGEFKLMEVNPRFWSSLPFTVQAGVDFPHLYWLQATGQPLPDSNNYTVDIGGHLLRGELLHLHSILREEYPLVEKPSFPGTLRDVAVSLLREPRFDYLSRDDPGPMLGELGQTVTGILETNLQSTDGREDKYDSQSDNKHNGQRDSTGEKYPEQSRSPLSTVRNEVKKRTQ